MEFRTATSQDQDRIVNLHIDNWRETYRGALADRYLDDQISDDRQQDWTQRLTHPAENQLVLVAKEGDALCGFVCAYGNHHAQFGTLIENLHSNKSHRGRGIGKRLFLQAAEWSLKIYPDAGLYLEVVASNTAAIGFYEALGGIHVESNIWTPPGGGEVLEFSFYWENKELKELINWKNSQKQ
ncbi:MAG: ribosomal protein S18 acetylase RimI-like enzyme [Candidatus Promineifilaceae bacterium]|jgi:ribosomal protein S18 acetylase RimI-like enzyme